MIKVYYNKVACFEIANDAFCGEPIVQNLGELDTNEILHYVIGWLGISFQTYFKISKICLNKV